MSTRRTPPTRLSLLLGTVLLAGLVVGCGGKGGPAAYPATVRVDPAPAAAPPRGGAAPLPALPVAQLGDEAGSGRRIEQLEVVDQDLRLVVRGLAESYGLDYQFDPAVAGRVTTRLRDVTLAEALDALVLPHGYTYEIQGRVLRVTPSRLQTRIFALDYISMSRQGVGTTVIQRRLGATGGVGGFAGPAAQGGVFPGGVAGGGDVIQSVSVSDLWQEIQVSLEGLVFDNAGAPQAAGIPGQPGLQGTTRAPGAYSRVGDDGRRLIINPISGTVMISASPEKLAEVESFLATVEGSVHRQVLIEAKIVEVTLDRAFHFGIDWSFVQRFGNLDLRVGGGQNGAQFTLGGDVNDAEREIGIVLQALDSQGEVSVLSSPRVSVVNNQRAVINVATDEVFFSVTRQPVVGPTGATIGFNTEVVPQQIAVGITLDVLPQISVNNVITMNVRPVITDLVEVKEIRLEDGTQASAPVIDRRETDTVVRVRGGETIVIGGLMQSSRRDTNRGVPFLSSVPVFGKLFARSTHEMEKRELVIFLTPRIIAGQPPVGQ